MKSLIPGRAYKKRTKKNSTKTTPEMETLQVGNLSFKIPLTELNRRT